MQATRQTIDDASMPQMAMILDETVIGRELNQALFGKQCRDERAAVGRVQSCKVEWIKYKPAKNCTVCYRLAIADGATGGVNEQVLYGRVYADVNAPSRFLEGQPVAPVKPKFGRPMMYLQELGMLAWLFPNDRKLEGLGQLIDFRYLLSEPLPKVALSLYGTDWQIAAMTHELVHYVPEHTCTVRVDLKLRHDKTGESKDLQLYGKTYYNDAGAQTYRQMLELWHHVAAGKTALTVAQPCYYDSAAKTLWQTGVAGETLQHMEFASGRFLDALPLAAAAVAALHKLPVGCANTVASGDLIAKLHEMRAFLAQAMPDRARQIGQLIDRLVQEANPFDSRARATLHGDLHFGNILIDANQAALIDLDGLSQGSPLVDVGSFMAALIYHGAIEQSGEQKIMETIAVFCRAYQRHAQAPVDDAELRWHVAVALLIERVYRCFTRIKIGRIEVVDELIEQADRISLMDSGWVRA